MVIYEGVMWCLPEVCGIYEVNVWSSLYAILSEFVSLYGAYVVVYVVVILSYKWYLIFYVVFLNLHFGLLSGELILCFFFLVVLVGLHGVNVNVFVILLVFLVVLACLSVIGGVCLV